MNQNSLWPAAAALAVAAIAVFLSDLWFKTPASKLGTGAQGSRHIALNGLRGLVIFSVFMHHATIFHGYLRTGLWLTSQSYLQIHLGINKVFVLFMLSGFLFSAKLLNAKTSPSKSFNWLHFYVSRVLRLVPLYFFMLALVLVVIAVSSHFTLQEPVMSLLKHVLAWASFTFLGTPLVNAFDLTALAGIVWSLPYEWFFYLILPLVALVFRMRPSWPYLLLAVTSAVGLYFWQPMWGFMSGFAYGMVIALLVRLPWLVRLCTDRAGAAILAIACVVIATVAFPTGMTLGSHSLIFIAVTIMACGNSIFGLLNMRVLQSMGERSYSVYLMHSIVLYVAFKFIIGSQAAATLSGREHWLVIVGSIAVLIPLSYLTYRWIEQPCIRFAPQVSAWLTRQTTTGSGSSRMPKRS